MDNKKVKIERLKTGIGDLDQDILDGGIPKGHRILVTGTTGTLKSTFCFQVLYQAAKDGLNGAYLSLEQSADSILSQMLEMGYDFDNITLDSNNFEAIKPFFGNKGDKKGKPILSIIDIGYIRKGQKLKQKFSWLDAIEKQLSSMKKTVNPQVVVLDSLNILYHLDKDKFDDKRRDLFYVLDYLKELNVTSLIINEMQGGDERLSQFSVESYLVDGVIQLLQHRRELNVTREFHVVKMRNVNHSLDIYVMTFDDKNKFKFKKKIAEE